MNSIEELDQSINSDLDKLTKFISKLSSDPQKKQQQLSKCQQMISAIETLIESYELEISGLDKTTATQYNGQYKSVQSRFKQIKRSLQEQKTENTQKDALFAQRSINIRNENETESSQTTEPKVMTSQTMIQKGHDVQEDSIQRLKNIQFNVEEGNKIADEINEQLDKQIEQLDNIYETVKETETILSRTKTLIKYFQRALQTDKCLMCTLFLIAVAVIVIIILVATGKTGGGSSDDDINKDGQGGDPDSGETTKRFLGFFM